MTAIAFTADKISLSDIDKAETYNLLCGVAIARGQAVYIVAATGRLALSNGGASGTAKFAGFALQSGGVRDSISVLKRGRIGGFTLAGNYGSLAYLNDTDGVIGDAAGTVSKVIGVVVPLTDNYATPTKVLYVNADQWTAG